MKTLIVAGLILAMLTVVQSQGKVDLDALSEKISTQLESKFPGWQHRRVEPFGTPESKVVVQGWGVPNRNVQIAIAVRESVDAAMKEIRSYLEFRREPKTLTGFGDEAFRPEPNGPQVVLRRGRYVIYISTVIFIEEDADAQSLTKSEQQARQKTEVERILNEFATHMSAIELPE